MKHHPYWTERRVVKYLRECNAVYDGPGVPLVVDAHGVLTSDIEGSATPAKYLCYVPGDNIRFDAIQEARQLLAAWRDAQDEINPVPVGAKRR
jgi:hypothetical protein